MIIHRRTLMASAVALMVPGARGAGAAEGELVGGGGNTIRPVMAGWLEAQPKSAGLKIVYNGVGTPRATSQILAGITDFAILEVPLPDDQLESANLFQFPLAFASIVFVVNIPGIQTNQLALSGQLLGGIYWGTIKKWNDPKIVAVNPGLTLPDLDIRPLYHGDVQGQNFTDTIGVTSYMLAANADWRAKFGATVPKRWTTASMSASGDTITNTIQAIEGSISYLPLGAAVSAKLPIVLKRDDKGKNVTANAESLHAAVAAVDWEKALTTGVKLIDLPGEGVWPIVLASYGVIPRDLKAKPTGAALHSFFKFVLTDGAEISRKRGGEPLPAAVRAKVLGSLDKFLA